MGRASGLLRVAFSGLMALSLVAALWAGTLSLLDSCEDVGNWEASGEATLAKAEGRPGAGSALLLQFTTNKEKAPAFVRRPLRGDPTWELPEGGLSLWLKGDGSTGFFAVELVDSSFKHRYAALLPLKETDWHRADLPWREFVPEIYHPEAEPLPLCDPKGGLKPSIVFNLFLGRWFYFLNHFAPYQVTVDDITLETSLPFDATDYTPPAAGLPRTLAKLQGKEPVTIVCMGDSITFGVGVGGPPGAYPGKLEALLRQRFAHDNIKVVNSGVGGLQVPQGNVLIPRDVVPYDPDLVTVLYGYNDLAPGGVTRDQFQAAVSVFVDRVRRLTKGRAEVLLLSSLPGTSDEAWERLKAGAETIRELAQEMRCGLCDADAPFRALGREKLVAEYFREKDAAHPNARGQDLLASLLLEAIAGK